MQENDAQKLQGLSAKEVKKRQNLDGFNELAEAKKKNIFGMLIAVVAEPMIILLLVCGSLYFLLGDIQESVILLSSITLVIGISVYQENKTEKALQALKDLSSPKACVVRDGTRIRIPGREIVCDDIVFVEEGDKVPADCEIVWSKNMTVDESLLTGESVPVRKSSTEKSNDNTHRPGGDDSPFLFSGSLVTQGECIAKVYAIGEKTEMGRIGKVLKTIAPEKTFLQKEVKKIVQYAFVIAMIFCIAVFLIYYISQGDIVQGLLSGLTLAMSILPEEFPVVLTVFLAIGAWRLSKKKVLTRNMHAVETLGACTVLCCDKTGTITENKMTVQKIMYNGKEHTIDMGSTIPKEFHELIEYGILASKKNSFDPMEVSLEKIAPYIKKTHTESLIHTEEYSLTKEFLAMSHVRKGDKDMYVVASKGAPETIMDLCHVTQKEKLQIEKDMKTMASQGLRVLGVAKAYSSKKMLPKQQHDFAFTFVGLIGWIDPVRDAVPQAIQDCYTAGIKIIMITGDYPLTAQYIGKKIGLKYTDTILTGEELRMLPEKELLTRLQKTSIIARVMPEEKLTIVNLLKKNGEFVAMTGDGVNDAPALKSAHIGVAMGARGTDVARESSAIVLLDDSFSSIVHGVRMGRRIFDNLKKAMIYIASVHVPIAGITILSLSFGRPVVFFPVHVVFLELLIDPACSVIFEAEKEEDTIMNRPPRASTEPLFGRRTLMISILQGIFALICVGCVLWFLHTLGVEDALARTATFIALVVSNISLILVNRSWSKNAISLLWVKNETLFPVVIGAIIALCCVVYIPVLQNVFHFAPLHWSYVILAVAAGVISVAWFEVVKVFFRKKNIPLLKD